MANEMKPATGTDLPPGPQTQSPTGDADKSIAIDAVPPHGAAAPVETPTAEVPWDQPLTPEGLAEDMGRLDRILAAFAVVLAFFAGSFLAQNTDVWMHLATGRLIANGQQTFGTDPFAYTTSGVRWVNHAWLYDVGSYFLSEALGGIEDGLGGAALVLVKGLAIALLAWLMILMTRPDQGYWLPVVCTTAALFAMAPRLLLQPSYLSYLFLGLTLFILYRSGVVGDRGQASTESGAAPPNGGLWAVFLLPVLFALWVNVDEWYILGPAVVALCLLGEIAQAVTARVAVPGRALRLGILAVVLVLSAGACLVSPYGVDGLTMPQEIWGLTSGSALQSDPLFQAFFWQGLGTREYITSVGGWFYLLLIALGLGSFASVFPDLRYWRILVWGALLVLSAAQARAVPFFAIIAAPIAALNFQDFAVRKFGAIPDVHGNFKNWSLAGRMASVVAGIILLILAWPGWLQENPEDARRSRHVAWGVAVDPSLTRACKELSALHKEGVIGRDEHGFNWHPDMANYCAWFCPEEKSFFDYRFALFPEAGPAFVEARDSLFRQATEPGKEAQPGERPAWEKVFRDDRYRVGHLIVTDPAQARTLPVVLRLWRDTDRWIPIYTDGRTTILAWGEGMPAAARAAADRRIDVDKLALGPSVPPSAASPANAPEAGRRRSPWSTYMYGPAPRALAADEASLYLGLYSTLPAGWVPYADFAWQYLLPVGAATAPTGPGALAWLMPHVDVSMLAQGQGIEPPSAAILAVRAARRAIQESPDNADGYLLLAEAYNRLSTTQERPWASGRAQSLQQIRLIQIVNALQTALALRPDAFHVHRLLADTYRGLRYIDYELEQREEYIRAVRAAGPSRRETPEGFQRKLDLLENELQQREKETDIQHRRNDYDLRAAALPPAARAGLAVQLGLFRQAVDALREMDPSSFGSQEADLMVYLLIATGQADDVRRAEFVLSDTYASLMGLVTGDYERARQHLARLTSAKEDLNAAKLLLLVRSQSFQGGIAPDTLKSMNDLVTDYYQSVDSEVLAGLAALELGDTRSAAVRFHKALDVSAALLRPSRATPLLAASNPLEVLTIGWAQTSAPPAVAPSRLVAEGYLKWLRRQGVRSDLWVGAPAGDSYARAQKGTWNPSQN